MGCGASKSNQQPTVTPREDTNPFTTDALPTNLNDLKPKLEQELRTLLSADGCLDDLQERKLSELLHPAAIAPFSAFGYRLYSSAAATAALRSLLRCKVAGTTDSFDTILSAIARGSAPTSKEANRHYCYLVGGQVRDVLRGELSTDVDFNYSCSAKEVALVTVEREWATKYKQIGEDGKAPNYVLIGDEASDMYLEGFSIDFNATKACCHMDFRKNMLLYDLANDIIIDKTGFGVADVRAGSLRLSCAGATGETTQMWATSSNLTPGFKQLRYIKFLLRAAGKGKHLATDDDERAFVISSLADALKTNIDALRGFWFGYALKSQLQTTEGVTALQAWVREHGKEGWWEESWEPLVRACT